MTYSSFNLRLLLLFFFLLLLDKEYSIYGNVIESHKSESKLYISYFFII